MHKVIILMSTYNGEKYLKEQLDSLKNQIDVKLKLVVRDDGSTDNTINILNEYSDKMNLEYYVGDNIGVPGSFIDLFENCKEEADYYAFCDQDDFWEENKLASAIKFMEKDKTFNKPSMYYSNVTITDKNLNIIGKSSVEKVKDTLPLAFANNPATGCTIVFNKSLKNVIVFPKKYNIRMHDWWLYKVCLLIGGNIHKDTFSYIKYRQHDNNVIGAKTERSKLDNLREYIKKINYFSSEAEILKELYLNKIDNANLKKINKAIKLNKINCIQKILIIFDKDYNIGILKQTIRLKLSIILFKKRK